MKLKDQIKQALATNDAALALRVANGMRFGTFKLKNGTPVLFTYDDMMTCVSRVTGIPKDDVAPQWEDLLSHGEHLESIGMLEK